MDLRAGLPSVTTPTLVLSGAQDPSIPPSHGRLIADAIRGSRYELLDPAAHLATVERADAVNELITGFLQMSDDPYEAGMAGAPRGARRRPRRPRGRAHDRLHPGLPGAHHASRLGVGLDPARASTAAPARRSR